jgi:hypothetical protein
MRLDMSLTQYINGFKHDCHGRNSDVEVERAVADYGEELRDESWSQRADSITIYIL